MDLRLPHSWLTDYCTPVISPKELAAKVSLSGPTIDRIAQEEGEWMYSAEITTNRVDAFSITGFAREVAAILRVSFQEVFSSARKARSLAGVPKADAQRIISVAIKHPSCRRYMAVMLSNITIKPSPEWMQKRLILCGLRPINNVVDITNYVMLEYGQPTHAFDADLLAGAPDDISLVARGARTGEHFLTLDKQEKKLDPSMVVIADKKKSLALGGIKGGSTAGITEETRTIVLESANFDPHAIRVTSRALDLRTDSSVRYEKNLSPEYCEYVLARAMELLAQHAGAHQASTIADVYPHPESEKNIIFDQTLIRRILGVSVPQKDVERMLRALGFLVESKDSSLQVGVPFWRRADIEGDGGADMVEEIGRMYGYQNLLHEPLRGSVPLIARDVTFARERETKDFLKEQGWTECMTYSFISKKMLDQGEIRLSDALPVYNPLSAEFEYLRPSLVPSMLSVLAENEQKCPVLQIFEASTIYLPKGKAELPDERCALVGMRMAREDRRVLFAALKGISESLVRRWFGSFASEVVSEELSKDAHFIAKEQGVQVLFRKKCIGMVGLLRADRAHAWGLKDPVALYEFDFSAIVPFMTHAKKYDPIPKYPAIIRDVAFLIESTHSYADIVRALEKTDPLVRSVELFDIFENAKLGQNRRSLAFHVTYQSPERTLTAEEVERVHERILGILKKKFNAEIR